jgi:Uma2 family endonuclease
MSGTPANWSETLPPDGTVLSTADYLSTPVSNRVQELWYGVLHLRDAPTAWHQSLAFEIAIAIRAHARQRGLGRVWLAPVDVILDNDRALVVQPDIVFVTDERLDIVTDKVRGAPDLVVEVLSPLPRIGAVNQRVAWFATYGVQECWLVDQCSGKIEVLTFGEGRIVHRAEVGTGELVPSRVLDGLAFKLDDVVGWGAL